MYIAKAKPVKSKGKQQTEDMLLFDEEFMFLKCKQDFAKEGEKKINAATERKKKWVQGMDEKRNSVIYSAEICVCSMQNAAFVNMQKANRLRVKMLCSVLQQSPAAGSIGCLSASVDLPPAEVAITPKVVSLPWDRSNTVTGQRRDYNS